MNRQRWAAVVAPLAAGALVLSACGGGTTGGGNAQVREMGTADINAQPVENLQDGGSVNLPLAQWPQQWNLNQVDGASVDLFLVGHAISFEPFAQQADGTVKVNTNFLLSADLISTTPQVVEMKINPKARWSDGMPITWRDIQANWQAQNGKNGDYQPANTAGWEDIDSVERGADDQDVLVRFGKPFSEWKGLTNFIYPASHYSTPDQFNKDWVDQIPVTAGPYRVKQIDNTGKVLVLERDPNWWGPKPKLDTITFRQVSASAQPQAFAGGALDAVDIGPDVATFQTLQQDADAEIRTALAPNWRVLNFNAKAGTPLSDPQVRIGVIRGIDRVALGKAVIGPIVPDVRPLNNRIYVEGQKYYQDDGAPYSYDPAAAGKALDAAGWTLPAGGQVRQKDGKPLTISLMYPAGTPVSANEGQVIKQQLSAIGVDVTFNVVDLNAWQTQYLQVGNFEMQNMAWEGTPFPISSSSGIYIYDPNNIAQNYGRIPDTEGIGDLFKKSFTEFDDDKRAAIGNEIDQALWREGFSLPLYQRPDAWGVKKGLANFGAFGFGAPDYTTVGWMK
ncbi:ABC transporter family substrate-binding protein [Amycolatopsis taiwanensis]|uniref:ABC transporter substrate-binding protein n=1 Tax=Amycolatopsis taiwanensis TaxID=342230 RepID=A0A9W6VJ94_9PSEU|nr:ABC transporter family substrate-binding protein [Amycolatopsis taiwanensis]GLY69232.1 ABC transporter substrate-binding protein [Amycolatopsis taiwanensis]